MVKLESVATSVPEGRGFMPPTFAAPAMPRARATSFSLQNNLIPYSAGACGAVFMLVGRWSIGRIWSASEALDVGLTLDMALEPRVWMVIGLFLSTLLAGVVYRQRSVPALSPVNMLAAQKIVISLAGLLSYMLLTVGWSSEPDLWLSMYKAVEVVLQIVVLLLSWSWLRSQNGAAYVTGFWWTFLGVTIAMAGLAMMSSSGDRMAVLGGGPNIFGRLMGAMAVICFNMPSRIAPLFLPAMAAGLLLTVSSGSRGAWLAVLGAMMTAVLVDRSRLSRKVLVFTGVVLAALVVIQFTPLGAYVSQVVEERFMKLTVEKGYTSDRDILLEQAADTWIQYPVFGCGLNGFSYAGNSSGYYPHNLFMEIGSEGGSLGFVLLLLPLLMTANYLYRNSAEVDRTTLAVFVLNLIGSQFSGNLFDSRTVLLMIPMMISLQAPAGLSVVAEKRTGGVQSSRYRYRS